ncbi:MAG: peptide chain release factor N(5)-glutamine methyltransferase [Acidobacteria bacterium]|nr:MAG: peptide chain release factor N(5)-glutamine methyltransferase [Acidobacteriota bacterium]
MSLKARIAAARDRLSEAGIDRRQAAFDAELLAREALGWDRARLLAWHGDPPPPGFDAAYEPLIARRVRREPVTTIIGRREFMGLEFEVTSEVLSPRPETEFIVEEALACLEPVEGRAPFTLVDVGTGSGCLAICLARALPAARVIATDVSGTALAVAGRNAQRHQVDGRIDFRRVSMLDGITGPLPVIVSNPPYVATGDIRGLSPEVREFEPFVALDGGSDGLWLIRTLLARSAAALEPGGWLIFEFGYGQEDGVREAIAASGLGLVRIREDLQGIPRTAVTRKNRG